MLMMRRNTVTARITAIEMKFDNIRDFSRTIADELIVEKGTMTTRFHDVPETCLKNATYCFPFSFTFPIPSFFSERTCLKLSGTLIPGVSSNFFTMLYELSGAQIYVLSFDKSRP